MNRENKIYPKRKAVIAIMLDLKNSTAKQRGEKIVECELRIADLKEEIEGVEKKAAQLTSENSTKIDRRDAVTKQINSTKTMGGWIIFLGVVLGAIAALFLKNEGQEILRIGGIIVGVGVLILGIIVKNGWKKYENEKNLADTDLAEYDSKMSAYNQQIDSRKDKIRDYEAQISAIQDYEANMQYYRWVDDTSKGHIFVFVTTDLRMIDVEPPKPVEGKLYDKHITPNMDIYVNDMVFASGKKLYTGSQIGCYAHVELIDEGTQKLQIRLSDTMDKVSKPIPVRRDSNSVYIWWHVSIRLKSECSYIQEYHSMEDFRKAVGLTKDEMKRCMEK